MLIKFSASGPGWVFGGRDLANRETAAAGCSTKACWSCPLNIWHEEESWSTWQVCALICYNNTPDVRLILVILCLSQLPLNLVSQVVQTDYVKAETCTEATDPSSAYASDWKPNNAWASNSRAAAAIQRCRWSWRADKRGRCPGSGAYCRANGHRQTWRLGRTIGISLLSTN